MRSLISLVILICLFAITGCDRRANVIKRNLSPAIIGGTEASIEEFPFAINIWFDSPGDNYVEHLCGGSLIASRWVLTAAHCVLEDESESRMRVVNPKKLKLYLGSAHNSGEGARLLKIKSIQTHPDFSWPHHDVALIELATAVDDVVPVSLENVDLGQSTESVIAIGWGLQDAEGRSESVVLQQVKVDLLPRDLCARDEFPRTREIQIGRDMLCIQTRNHQTSSCPGDSGGPLLRKVGLKYQQIGVVSWGSACGGKRSGQSSAAGYSDVSNALPWIQKVIGP